VNRLLRRTSAALLATVVAAPVLLAQVASGEESAPAGSSGIGDAYWPLDGNGGIEVASYRIENRYDLASRRLEGRTILVLTATSELGSFNLDFLLPVTKVTVDGERASHARPDEHELRITPDAPLAAGTTHRVVVRYAGNPADKRYAGQRNWLASDREVVAMNQPHMAPWWFPGNDHPSDKATFDISTTVDRGREVVANGTLVSKSRTKSTVTWRWRAEDPMATYLAFFAAGDFEIDRGTTRGLPWVNAVSRLQDERTRAGSMRALRTSASVVKGLEKDLGPYPFEVTGGLSTGLPVGFALENQTRPTYPTLGGPAEGLVVHELAHQWFGDDVAVARWSDIWLNEGAATFMEWRWVERKGTRSAADILRGSYDGLPAGDPFWELTIGDPGKGRIFDNAVYERGAMTLQALRQRIGEDAFWLLLRTWLQQESGGNATTQDFEALAASVSGQDLTSFFTAWLRTPAKPARTADNGLA
jgi:aminopeptidase N